MMSLISGDIVCRRWRRTSSVSL